MYESALPQFHENNEQMVDGSYIKLADYCKKPNRSCTEFYKQVVNKSGFITCPKGYTCYVENRKVYTSMKVQGHYNRKMVKQHERNLSNPVITTNQILSLVKSESHNENCLEAQTQCNEKTNMLLHDARQTSTEINYKSIKLYDLLQGLRANPKNKTTIEEITEISTNIFHNSNVIVNKFTLIDILTNPESVSFGSKTICDIYRKFDRARNLIDSKAREKLIKIKYHNREGKMPVNMYQTFDQIPYILLDNAIKYSDTNSTIDVEFIRRSNKVHITVISIGPEVLEGEPEQLFSFSFRGEKAKERDSTGSGIGLYLAKIICDAHGFDIRIKTDKCAQGIILNEKCEFSVSIEAPLSE